MTPQQIMKQFLRYGSMVIMSNIERASLMIAGFIDMIGLRVSEIATIKESIVSINEFSKGLSASTGIQGRNAQLISESIEKVNAGAQDFVDQSQLLSQSSSQLREMALLLSQKLKQFKL